MNLYYKIKNAISDLRYDLRVRCQRFKRGYSWSDVWNMDCWFKNMAKPMLTHLRDHGIGVPWELYKEGAENEREAWEEILTEMANCLTLMDEDEAEKYLGIADDDYSFESYQKVRDLMDENKDRFSELFGKYFYNLWD
jgi:hypothetical protein